MDLTPNRRGPNVPDACETMPFTIRFSCLTANTRLVLRLPIASNTGAQAE